MVEDDNFIPDDSELEFLKQEQDTALFNKGYDEPIDNKFLWNYIGGRQMGYGGDELKIIEDTAFSEIMDYMDANDIHYSEIDVYDFIPENKRLSPYLIFQLGQRNEYYTNDLVEYMISVTRRTPSGVYDFDLDEIIDAPPSHYMAEYALKGADAQGPEQKLIQQAKIISGEYTEGDLKKLKFKKFFEKQSLYNKASDVKIKFVNNLFPGGSYEAYLDESHRRNMEKMGMTPEGDWLPEVKEKLIIKSTDADGKVTYTDFYGEEVSPDDPRISDESKFDDIVKDLETPPENLTEEQKVKKLYDNGAISETEYKQALKGEGIFAITPTNVVDDGIELYHSISKGETVNKKFHAGTYNAALDRASQFYGGEQLYKIANDNLNFIQEQANDLVSELSEQVSFEKVGDFYEVTDGMVTREITITLPTGVEADFNIVAETSNNDLTVKFQDLDGYDGEEIYSETLWDIENEPNSLKSSTSTINIIDDENVAAGFLDELGLKSQAGDFNLRNGYDLYKVNIKPGANVVNIPNTAIFVEFGIEKEMSADFIQGFIERPGDVNQYTNVTQIKIDGKTYDITNDFTSAQALQKHFKDADVLVYTNDIEDVGSKSYIFMNENSYGLEKIDDAQFNIDVANKHIKNNPYATVSKLAREEAFTKPERYQVLIDALLNETDTPTNVASSYHYNVEMVDGYPINQNPENFWTNPEDAIFGQQYKIDEFVDELIRLNAPIKNHPVMQQLIKMMPNIDPNAGAATLIQNLDDRPTNPFGVFSDKRDFTNKIGESLYTRYTVRNYFNNTDTVDFIENTLIPALENKTLSKFDDVNRTNLSKFIYYLHHFETSGAFDAYDSKADIIKKVIYGDVPVMETGVDFNTNSINQEIDLLNIAGVDKTVVDLVVDNQIEIKNIMQTHLAKVQNSYLPDTDYIVVFRAGELGVHGGATPISSASKSYNVSEGMLFYQSSMGRNAGEADPKVKAYLVNTAEIIDTEALGIRGGIDGNEMEILAPDSAFIELDESTLEKIMQGDTIDEDIAKIVPRTEGGTVGAAKANDPRFGSKDVSEYVTDEGRNKWMELVDEAPEVFEDIYKASKKLVGKGLSALQVFDPGDIVIVESLRRLAPALGLASIAAPALSAYVAYEVGVLLVDVGQALNKARVNQGLGTVAEAGGAIFGGTENADWRKLGKDTFKQFGEVSDDWSLSWKISEPIINYVFKEYTELKNKREEQDYISNIETGVSPR